MPVTVFQSQLTSQVNKLIGKITDRDRTREEGSTRTDIEAYQGMLRFDPVTRFGCELVHLYCYSLMGEYQHPRSRVQKETIALIKGIKGSWFQLYKMISSAIWYGYSWSEVAILDQTNGKKGVAQIRTLNPLLYDFAGTPGNLTKVKYQGDTSGEVSIELDYNTGIHLVMGAEISFDEAYGCGRLEAALPYWDLHQLMMPVLAIASQRQSTPILIKKTETELDVEVVDSSGQVVTNPATGKPLLIKKGWDAVQQLVNLGSAGVAAIDPDDDLYSIDPKLASTFLLELLKTCEQYRMMACLVPTTLASTSTTGIGDSGLSDRHFQIFQEINQGVTQYICEEIVDQLIRPLIIYNYGDIGDYGFFPVEIQNENSQAIATLIVDAVARGAFLKTDVNALNKLREILEIEPLTPEEIALMTAQTLATTDPTSTPSTTNTVNTSEVAPQ